MSLFTIGRPEHIDLAVPPLTPGKPSGQTMRQIVEGYSKWVTRDWARAVNIEYRAGPSGPSVSLIAEGGTIYIPAGDIRWPVMIATKTGVIIKEKPSIAELKEARWAFSAGPWLIREGKSLDISAEIKFGGFSGLDEASRRERAAIGIREDGAIVHIADMSMTLWQIREALLEKGCREAIGLDGGGSLGVLDPEGNILLGYSARQVCCALIFKRLIEEGGFETKLPELEKGGDEQMIVCIDPGHGGIDPGAVNLVEGLYEKDITLNVSLRLAEYLRRRGVKVVLTRTTDTDLAPGSDDDAELKARGVVSNINKSDVFISIHVDAFPSDPEANGSTVHYWPGSVKGKALAESVSRSLGIASGLSSRGVKGTNFGVLRYAEAPAILIELGFMTNKADRWSLREPSVQDKCALGIAFGILAVRA